MAESANDKYILSSLSNALDVLDLLGKSTELSIPEIAQQSGLTKSSLFRILTTLESKHFVLKSDRARYSLGPKLISLGNSVARHNGVEKFAHPHLMALTATSGETSHMGILDGAVNLLFVDKVVSESTIRMDSLVGLRRKAHCVGCGKALLAWQPEKFLEAYCQLVDFSPMTKASITSAVELKKVLAKIRADGYSLDEEESEIGLFCVAAPVFDSNGNAIAAISISGPAERMKSNLDRNIELVKTTAAEISAELR